MSGRRSSRTRNASTSTNTFGGRQYAFFGAERTLQVLKRLRQLDSGPSQWQASRTGGDDFVTDTIVGNGQHESWAEFRAALMDSDAYWLYSRGNFYINAAASGVQIVGGIAMTSTGFGMAGGLVLVANGADNFATSIANIVTGGDVDGRPFLSTTQTFLRETLGLSPHAAELTELSVVLAAGFAGGFAEMANSVTRTEAAAAARTEAMADYWIGRANKIAATPLGQSEFAFMADLPAAPPRAIAGEQLSLDFEAPLALGTPVGIQFRFGRRQNSDCGSGTVARPG